jgi:preprotein translocase subunit YajC
MNLLSILLLQAGAGSSSILFFGLMLAIFWLFMIRPQMKRQREQRAFQDALSKGTEVVTASGLLGKITKIDGEIVTLEVSPKTYLRVTKNAISKELTQSLYATTAQHKQSEVADRKPEDAAAAEGG